MATKPKFNSANDDKRPLYLECKGGPYPYMRVDEAVPLTHIPIHDETGSHALVGHYILQGSTYVFDVNK